MPNMDHVQAELMDMIAKDVSPSQISDKIKDMLYAKTSERVDAYKPTAADSLFGDEIEDEIEDEVESDVEAEADPVDDETDDE